MREVPRDDKWNEETDGRMKEVQQGMSDSMDNLESSLESTGPSETELVIVALLMRLYDVNMALLSHFDKPTADKIYDTHNEGGSFNPQIFIPSPDETSE
jgi:hypothetical protein